MLIGQGKRIFVFFKIVTVKVILHFIHIHVNRVGANGTYCHGLVQAPSPCRHFENREGNFFGGPVSRRVPFLKHF